MMTENSTRNLLKRQTEYYMYSKRNGKDWHALYNELLKNKNLYSQKEFLIEISALALAMRNFGITEYTEVPQINSILGRINSL